MTLTYLLIEKEIFSKFSCSKILVCSKSKLSDVFKFLSFLKGLFKGFLSLLKAFLLLSFKGTSLF